LLKQVMYLNLASLEEFGILTWLGHYQSAPKTM